MWKRSINAQETRSKVSVDLSTWVKFISFWSQFTGSKSSDSRKVPDTVLSCKWIIYIWLLSLNFSPVQIHVHQPRQLIQSQRGHEKSIFQPTSLVPTIREIHHPDPTLQDPGSWSHMMDHFYNLVARPIRFHDANDWLTAGVPVDCSESSQITSSAWFRMIFVSFDRG